MGCGNSDVSRDGLVSQPTEPPRASVRQDRAPRAVRAHVRQQRVREQRQAKEQKTKEQKAVKEQKAKQQKAKDQKSQKAREQKAKARTAKEQKAHRVKEEKLRQERVRNAQHLRELKEEAERNAGHPLVTKVRIKEPTRPRHGKRGWTDIWVAPAGSRFEGSNADGWTFIDPTGRAWTPGLARSMARTHNVSKPYTHAKLRQGEQRGPSGRPEPMPGAASIYGVVRQGMVDLDKG